MSVRFAVRMPIWFLLSILAACANSGVVPAGGTVLNEETVRLEGWFSARGEWTLFSTFDFERYNPYVKESDKCVSLINATGSQRSEYEAIHGKKVVVLGFALRYDGLSTGDSTADRLLSKKYFKGEVVENYCLRDFVFAVSAFGEEN